VPTYILLSTLSPHGVGTIKANPERLLEVNAEVEQMGAKVVQQWAVLGPYDFVNIVEAPDEKVIARVSVELAARGTAHFQTLTAIPVDEFLSLLKCADPSAAGAGSWPGASWAWRSRRTPADSA
jgi:uncharacterized protein with GYD domain